MDHYIVIKKVTLQAHGKEFFKDRIITASDVGSENITRFLDKGYIKPLGDKSTEPLQEGDIPPSGNTPKYPFYITADKFLTPEQINILPKPQLVEYAGHIGLTGFKSNIGASELKKLINQFIEEAMVDDENEEYEDDSEA